MTTYPAICPDCIFRGTVQVNGQPWSVFRCHDTVIFRYGPGGADYYSMRLSEFPYKLNRGQNHHMALPNCNVAFRLARQEGMI